MNSSNLFDHLYFEDQQIRFRILGPFTDDRLSAIIVRSIRHPDGSWIRPSTYATENREPEVERATSNLGSIFLAGRRFPLTVIEQLGKPINPFNWRAAATVSDTSRKLVSRLAVQAGIESVLGWGLVGSRLLGSERMNSDIDVVLGGESESLRHDVIKALEHYSVLQPCEHSRRARDFFRIYKGRNPKPECRNVFGGVWCGMRVDIYATFPRSLIGSVLELTEGVLRFQPIWTVRVISSAGRTAYPISFVVRGLTEPLREALLFSFDPTAHYLMEGDRVTASNVSLAEPAHGMVTAAFDRCIEAR